MIQRDNVKSPAELITAMGDHYLLRLNCSNCLQKNSVFVKKGRTVADALSVMGCPNCGCKDTLKQEFSR